MKSPTHTKFKNELSIVRSGRGLARKTVARILGHKRTSSLIRFENGERFPNLETALKLEILYRRPVAFLFPDLYVALREEIRAAEVAQNQGQQQTLF
jgi:DNA-binding XRE family transcriptional regulator